MRITRLQNITLATAEKDKDCKYNMKNNITPHFFINFAKIFTILTRCFTSIQDADSKNWPLRHVPSSQ